MESLKPQVSHSFASAVLWAATALMLFSVWTSPSVFVYDEPYHVQNAERIQHEGFKTTLTSSKNQSAAGPLHATVLLVTAPFTHLKVPALRWVNVALLFTLIALLASSLLSGSTWQEALLKAGSLLAVSFVWPSTGLVLTEIPALLFFTGFALVMRKALRSDEDESGQALLLAFAAGTLLGISILGRQTYLVALVALILLALIHPGRKGPLLICVAACLPVCGWLFFWWKGFVPPSQNFVDGTLQPVHTILAMAYLGTATFFLSPSWLMPLGPSRGWILCSGTIVFAGILLYSGSLPAKSLLARFDQNLPAVSFFSALFMGALGFLWLMRVMETARYDYPKPEALLWILLLLALAAAPAKISHTFSSRYVVGALTLQLLLMEKTLLFDWKSSSLRLVGCLLGFGILQSYYDAAS